MVSTGTMAKLGRIKGNWMILIFIAGGLTSYVMQTLKARGNPRLMV